MHERCTCTAACRAGGRQRPSLSAVHSVLSIIITVIDSLLCSKEPPFSFSSGSSFPLFSPVCFPLWCVSRAPMIPVQDFLAGQPDFPIVGETYRRYGARRAFAFSLSSCPTPPCLSCPFTTNMSKKKPPSPRLSSPPPLPSLPSPFCFYALSLTLHWSLYLHFLSSLLSSFAPIWDVFPSVLAIPAYLLQGTQV